MQNRYVSLGELYRLGEREARREHYRLDRIERRLLKICPILSEIDDISVGDLFHGGGFRGDGFFYASEEIRSELDNSVVGLGLGKAKTTIEERPNSAYVFKRTETSVFDICRDNGRREFDDSDFVNDTYYAIVDGDDIEEFVKASAGMANGEDQIDPLDDGKFHAAFVFVVSKEVLPIGIGELIRRKRASRNMCLRLIISEGGAKKFIEEFGPTNSLFENKPFLIL